jgi:hypothetical protein
MSAEGDICASDKPTDKKKRKLKSLLEKLEMLTKLDTEMARLKLDTILV